MVSVIIPCHNNRGEVGHAVTSVLKQTYDKIEVIVVDNGSSEPLTLSEAYLSDPRVRVLTFKEPLGAAGARNEGVKAAKGRYVAFLDADDYWEADKLSHQMKALKRCAEKKTEPVLCFTARRLYRSGGGRIKKGKVIHCDSVVDYKKLLKSNQISCSSVVMKKKFAVRCPFPEQADIHEDYAVWLKLLSAGGFAIGIDRPLLNYRVSPKSRSGNKLRSARMTYNVYRFIGLGVVESMGHMVTYMIEGIRKYL
ncbi:MAG: glycosyltransferase family 2 protein [Eubacterium sp.]|nr:glycosyltransferase family 2 protein [Eubacterium sp.]